MEFPCRCLIRQTKAKLVLGFALVLSGGLFGCSTAHNQLSDSPIRYHNGEYKLVFYLPQTWKGYSVLMSRWDGEKYLPEKDRVVVLARGPIITLRNPQWKTSEPCQDMPIYVFTRGQWDDLHVGKFDAAGAGGVLFELWHNDKYVFGIHSRYNANDSLDGWKDVQDILNKNCAAHSEPHLNDV
jgi:hypothetical protein